MKKISVILTVVVVALLIGVLFSCIQISELQNQIGELQAQNSELHEENSYLQDQNSNLQNQSDEMMAQVDLLQSKLDFEPRVRITVFSSQAGWLNVVGMTLAISLDITVINTGFSALDGLTLDVRRYAVDEDPYSHTIDLGSLNAGEKIETADAYIEGWDTYFSEFRGRGLVATLKFGDVVLDTRFLMPQFYL